MATGEISDIEIGGDEIFDFLCSVCRDQNKNTEADKFCSECSDYYCSSCVTFHYNIPALKQHIILDATQSQAGSTYQLPSVPTQKCKIHKHKPVDMYCKNHDVVACSVCMLGEHSSCKDKFYIPDYVKDNSDAANSTDIEDQLDTMAKIQERFLKSFIEDNEELKSSKDKSLKEIRQFREKINQVLDQFEKNTVQASEQTCQFQMDKIDCEVMELLASTTEIKAAQDSLQSAGSNNPQKFVSIIQAREIMNQAKRQIEGIELQDYPNKISFLANEKLQAISSEIQCLGSIHLEEALQIKDSKKYSVQVKVESDSVICDITSACALENGTIILADSINCKLKCLDSTCNSVADSCEVPEQPYQVCAISDTEVAVSCWYSKIIQFVSVQPMQNTRQIKTSDSWCFGLAHSDGKLFVSCVNDIGWCICSQLRRERMLPFILGAKLANMTLDAKWTEKKCEARKPYICVNSMSGAILQFFRENSEEWLFSDVRALTVSSDKSKIYVADLNNGLIILDINGKLVEQYKEGKFQGAYGVCLYKRDSVLVWGQKNQSILQFTSKGPLKGGALNINGKCSTVCLNKNTSKLIICFEMKDEIEVYIDAV